MFPYKNSVKVLIFTTCSLRHVVSCNSDNWVQTVIMMGPTFILWDKHIVSVVLR